MTVDTLSVQRVLANRRLSRVLAAFGGSAIGEWALWVGILVYAYEHGGSRAAGVTSVALLAPAAIVAPLAGRPADGPHPERALVAVYSVQATALTVAALLAAAGASAVVVTMAIAIATTGITFVRPTIAVVVPGAVSVPADLVAANVLTGLAESVSVLAGPLVASGLLAISGPIAVFWLCAATNAASALASCGLGNRDHRDATRASHRQSVTSVCRTVRRQGGTSTLLTVLGVQYLLVGALDLLIVNLAFAVLGLGSAGPGLLSVAFGVGAVSGGAASALFVGRRRLAVVMTGSIGTIGMAMALAGAWTTLAVTVGVLLAAGTARSLLDLSGRIMLQRCAPQDALASVFALLEMFAGMGILCGSVLAQLTIAHGGVRTALVVIAAVFVVLAIVTARGLARAEQHADAPVVEIRHLRRVGLFAPLPGPAIEGLARASVPCHFEPGATVVREGEPGDQYYVIADGEVVVDVAGAERRRMGRGEGFGEIALLADLPRTATVTATSTTNMLAIERDGFLAAVVGHEAAADAAWTLARHLHPALGAVRSSDGARACGVVPATPLTGGIHPVASADGSAH